MARELTREEKTAIRKLVTRLCANYDRDMGCLPLDCPCYMLEKCWTGALCRYFREAVLPNDPVLEASLDVYKRHIPDFPGGPVVGRCVLLADFSVGALGQAAGGNLGVGRRAHRHASYSDGDVYKRQIPRSTI